MKGRIMNTTYEAIILFTSLSFITIINGANILGIFPTPSYSHQQPFLALSKALAKKGHNVTIMTPNPTKDKIKNLLEIDLSLSYEVWKRNQSSSVMTLRNRHDGFQHNSLLVRVLKHITQATLENPEFIKFIRESNGSNYDLILYESFSYSALLGMRKLVGNPPVVGILTLHTFANSDVPMGNPSFPSFMPSIFLGHNDKMDLWERMKNVLTDLYSQYLLHQYLFPTQQELLSKYFITEKFTAEELEYNKSLLIVCTDIATGYPKPIQPNTIYVGPIHVQDSPEPLPQDLQRWMDEAEEAIIYFSLGSNMKGNSVPEHIRAAFIEVFKQFPKIRVLWKWEADDELPGRPKNVLVKKWFPQRSVLAHPKLKVFISQVGAQSFQEAVRNSVPILAIPLFGDQDFNAKKLVSSGAGLKLEFLEITYEEVKEKLKCLLTDPSYKKNMLRLLSISTDKPMPAINTAIWWIEYVIRHNGAPHLRPAALDLAWYQHLMLDILFFILCSAVVTLFVTYYVVKRLIRLISFNATKRIKIKEK